MKKEDYSDPSKYEDHLLEQYKLYVGMADKVSERRAHANQFYGTVLAGLLTIVTPLVTTLLGNNAATNNISLLFGAYSSTYIAIGFVGVILCWVWFNNIRSYDQLNSGKFKIVRQMEALLPYNCYVDEWKELGEGHDKSLYYPLTHVERWVPLIIGIPFFLIYFIGTLFLWTPSWLLATVLLVVLTDWLVYSVYPIIRPWILQKLGK